MAKILITGSEGILGGALMSCLPEAYGVDIRSRNKQDRIDLKDASSVSELIEGRFKPNIVIHTAAYTDVDGCELNSKKAFEENAASTKNVAMACKNIDAFLVYLSTDYIFDGSKKTAYTEEDIPSPISVYGRSKLKGEDHITQELDKYLIIRTSWMFGKGGKNFVDAVLKKAKTEKEIKVVDDQAGCPTYAEDLARAIAGLINSEVRCHPSTKLGAGRSEVRILNITNSGSCSWYEFAKEIIKQSGIKGVEIVPVASSQIKRPAKRPAMSVLDNSRFNKLGIEKMPSWQDALGRYLKVSL